MCGGVLRLLNAEPARLHYNQQYMLRTLDKTAKIEEMADYEGDAVHNLRENEATARRQRDMGYGPR